VRKQQSPAFTIILFVLQFICAQATQASDKPAKQTGKLIARQIQAAQLAGKEFPAFSLFDRVADDQLNESLKRDVDSFAVLGMKKNELKRLLSTRPELLKLIMPGYDNQPLEVVLMQHSIYTDDFVLKTSNGQTFAADQVDGLHYWGIVNNDMSSLVAISIFEDDIMGLIATEYGNLNLGKIKDSKNFILYNEFNLTEQNPFKCANYANDNKPVHVNTQAARQERSSNCVRLYWEINYDIFQAKGNTISTSNFATGVFNQTQILYANDGISVSLSQLLIWDTPSPYGGTDSYDWLNSFQHSLGAFNGDLAHLITNQTSLGGVAATIMGMCEWQDNRMCFSGATPAYNTLPTYSWTVNVITHEQGHLMGSPHTHACVWNGDMTAIDGCGPTYSSNINYEGNCSGAPIPVGGGTIMSYCHLGAAKVVLSKGFGVQPANAIINSINSATCLNTCTVCVPPVNDDCTGAITLTDRVSCSYTLGNIDCATADSGATPPTCNGNSATQYSVFYRFYAQSSIVSIVVEPTIAGGGLDPVIALYTGTDCNNLTEVVSGCSDNNSEGETETLVTDVVKGNYYWIRVYNYGNSLPVPGNGRFQICVSHQSPTACTIPGNTIVEDASGTNSALLVCSAAGGSGGTLLYKWYSGPDCAGPVTGTSVTYRATTEGYYACKAYIEGNESTCYACAYGLVTLSEPSTDIVMSESNSYAVCGAKFYDGGGTTGNYPDNQNDTITILPTAPGTSVSVNFHAFRTQTQYTEFKNTGAIADDVLFVYNGNSTNSPLLDAFLGQAAPGTITSTAADGSLTFVFISNKPNNAPGAGVRAGWSASVNCYPTAISEATQTAPKIEAYPNPADKLLTITCSGVPDGSYTLSLTNVIGQVVNEVQSEAINHTLNTVLNTDKIAPGMYFLTLHAGTVNRIIKIQKQ
jgi:hypothetical protein